MLIGYFTNMVGRYSKTKKLLLIIIKQNNE